MVGLCIDSHIYVYKEQKVIHTCTLKTKTYDRILFVLVSLEVKEVTRVCELCVYYSSNEVVNSTALRFADHCGNCSVSMPTEPCEYTATLTNCFLNKERTKRIL